MTIRAYTGRPNPRDALANAGRPRPPSLAAFTKSMGLDDLQQGQGMDGGMPIRMGGPGRSPSGPEKKKSGGLASMLGGPMGGAVMQGLGDAMMMYALTLAGGDQAESMASIMGRRDNLNAADAEQQRYEGEQAYTKERDEKQFGLDTEKLNVQREGIAQDAKQAEIERLDDLKRDAIAQGNVERAHELDLLKVKIQQQGLAYQQGRDARADAERAAAKKAVMDFSMALLTAPPGQNGLANLVAQPQPMSASAAEAPPQAQPASMPQPAAPQDQGLQEKFAALPRAQKEQFAKLIADQNVEGMNKFIAEVAAPPDQTKQFANAATLRDDYTKLTTPYATVRDAYSRLKEVAKTPTPAGDLALIYNYVRLLDPGSVVRESEFAIAASAGSWGTQVQNAVQKALSGERMTPGQRADFVSQADALYRGQETSFRATTDQFRGMAERAGLNPDDILTQPEYQNSGAGQSQQGGGEMGGAEAAPIPQPKGYGEYQMLPSGTEYLDPQGNKRRKP